MTESEIVYQISELFNRAWSIQQWWASISVGLLVLSFVASDRLNAFLVALVVLIYSAFTFHFITTLATINETVYGYSSDLQALEKSGYELGNGSIVFSQPYSKVATLFFYLALCGTYFGCVSYLIYSFIKKRRAARA